MNKGIVRCKQCNIADALCFLALPGKRLYVCLSCRAALLAEAKKSFCCIYIGGNEGRPCACKPGHLGMCNSLYTPPVEKTTEDKKLDNAIKQGKLF